MSFKIPKSLGIFAPLGAVLLLAGAQASNAESLTFVGNADVKSKIQRGEASLGADGSVSIALTGDRDAIRGGSVSLDGLNFVFGGVDQEALSGKRQAKGKSGVLGFSLKPTKAGTQLKYDAKKLELNGKLRGQIDYSYLASLGKMPATRKDDHVVTPVMPVVGTLSGVLDQPIQLASEGCGPFKLRFTGRIKLVAKGLPQFGIPGFTQWIEIPSLIIEYTCFRKFNIGRELCIQPVSVKSANWDPNPTGAGLAFGLPGARREWRKGNVFFKVRPTITVVSSAYKIVTETEMNGLRGLVESDDCIEVFFAKEFSPNALYGGGATWGLGTATSQVVSSDENALHGIDLTHLAHELGHVISLKHPGSGYPTAAAPTVFDGTTGTLMCPSGFMNDNPSVNSKDNKDHVSNPLFKFKLSPAATATDCQDDADCGSC
jgi:hypothetical protein